MNNWDQLSLGLDFSRPPAPPPAIMVTKTTCPVVVEETSSWAAKMCIPILILVSAYAGSNGMRRPSFLPTGLLEGAASLAAEAYSLGICEYLNEDPDDELNSASSLFPSHRVITGGE